MTTVTEEGFRLYEKRLPADVEKGVKELGEACRYLESAKAAFMENILLWDTAHDVEHLHKKIDEIKAQMEGVTGALTVEKMMENTERAVAALSADAKRTSLPDWIKWFGKRVARNARRDGRETVQTEDVSEAEDALIRKGVDYSLEGMNNAIRRGWFLFSD